MQRVYLYSVAILAVFVTIVYHFKAKSGGYGAYDRQTLSALTLTRQAERVHDSLQVSAGKLFQTRSRAVLEHCRRQRRFHDPLGWYSVDDKHKLFMCPVPKVGSTFWQMIIAKLSRDVGNVKIQQNLTPLTNSMPLSELIFVKDWLTVSANYTEYSRVLFTREPYHRLYSTFIDKLLSPNYYYWKEYGSQINKFIRRRKTKKAFCGDDITFREFIKYVIYIYDNRKTFDVHIDPVSRLCNPCGMKYDVIGKMESFLEDTQKALEVLKVDSNIDLKSFIREYKLEEVRLQVELVILSLYRKGLRRCVDESAAVKRLWRNLQLRGKIDPDLSVPRIDELVRRKQLDADLLLRSIYNGIEASKKRRRQHVMSSFKKQAYIEAYRTVDMKDKLRITEIYQSDFRMFGYNERPADVFR